MSKDKISDQIKAMRKEFNESLETMRKEQNDIWSELTDEQKIAATCVVVRAIIENAKQPCGTFRHLIYDILCLPYGDSYTPCYDAGLLDINNALSSVVEKTDENS